MKNGDQFAKKFSDEIVQTDIYGKDGSGNEVGQYLCIWPISGTGKKRY